MDIKLCRCFDDEGYIKVALIYTNPGDTTEIFHHVTYITINCGLEEKLAIRRNEHLPCQAMLKYT